MATRKPSRKSSITEVTKSVTARKGSRGKTSRLTSRAAKVMASIPRIPRKYMGPAAALVGTGLLGGGGVLMREELGKMMGGLMKGAMSELLAVTKHLNSDDLLGYVGLQKRRGIMASLAPGLGALAGMVAGSALTFMLVPRLRRMLMSEPEPTIKPPSASAATGDNVPGNSFAPTTSNSSSFGEAV